MTTHALNTPLTDADIEKLRAGDVVLLNGIIYSGRDAAHKKLMDLLDRGEALPFDLKGASIYYVGPSPAPPGRPIGSAGPTTSYRMDAYAPRLHALGLKATIGKGKRSDEVRQAMRDLTPLVEPLSIDEAFLDLTGTERLHGAPPAIVLARFARRIEQEIGITVSVGLSFNKFLAKIASDIDKPRGFAAIGRAEALDFLAGKPVSLIWGVGRALQEALERDGLRLIADLRRIDEGDLMRRYGAMGLRLSRLSRGIDDRRVSPDSEVKSISAETTFETDIRDARTLEKKLFQLCEKVSARAKAQGFAGSTVTLKLKSADFRLRTRSRGLASPTVLAARLFETGRDMLMKEVDGTAYRLIGIGIADLGDIDKADPADLVDTSIVRTAKVEGAVDALRARFGKDAVVKGITFDD